MAIFEERTRIGMQYANYGWQNNDPVFQGMIEFGYIAGYKDAADQLVGKNYKSPIKDMVIFPIIFLYRQYLELAFKNIILKEYKNDDEKASNMIKKCSHNLNKIWNEAKLILKLESDEEKIINDVIYEFNKYDFCSFNFRYYFDKKLNSTLPKNLSVDLNKLYYDLEKIDCIIAYTYN